MLILNAEFVVVWDGCAKTTQNVPGWTRAMDANAGRG